MSVGVIICGPSFQIYFAGFHWYFFVLYIEFGVHRNGGQTGGEIWVDIEFIADSDPTLQIEKNVIKIPEI